MITYDSVEIITKFLVLLDYWQGIGDIGDVWLVSIFSLLERFPLRLKILDHQVPLDVGSDDASSIGLIISYYFTRGEYLLLVFCSKDEGWCWDRCPRCCIWRGVWDPSSRASETICDLFNCVFLKVHQIVNVRDPLISQLHYCFVQYSHLCVIMKESRCLRFFLNILNYLYCFPTL